MEATGGSHIPTAFTLHTVQRDVKCPAATEVVPGTHSTQIKLIKLITLQAKPLFHRTETAA